MEGARRDFRRDEGTKVIFGRGGDKVEESEILNGVFRGEGHRGGVGVRVGGGGVALCGVRVGT